jgi:hypothetical protein
MERRSVPLQAGTNKGIGFGAVNLDAIKVEPKTKAKRNPLVSTAHDSRIWHRARQVGIWLSVYEYAP